MLGPTGGYLFGMLPAVFAGSLVMKALEKKKRLAVLLSALVNTFITYLVGIPWLAVRMDISITAALASGFLPFIVGDTLKIIVTVIACLPIRVRVKELLERQ